MLDFIEELESKNIRVSLKGRDLEINFDGELDNEIIVRLKDKKQELIQFLSENAIQKNGIAKAEQKEDYAVSNAQKRLWIQSQLSEYSAAYNLVNRSEITGDYDLQLFEKALQRVISRHEILRTVFRLNNNGEIRQLIAKDTKDSFKIDWRDFSAQPNADHLADLYIEEDKGKTFDLEHGPLFRIAFLRIAEDHYVIYSCMHHIITDGWSFDVLIHEIFAFYEAFKAGVNCELEELRIQYKDYAEWQAKNIVNDKYSIYKEYWIEKLSGELPKLDLTGAKSRPKFLTHNGYRLNSFISPELTHKFRKLCQNEGTSLYMGLVAFLNILLYKYTAQQNILIGTPVAGREDSDLEAQIGCFVNTIVLKNTVDPSNNFKSFLNSVKDSVLSDFSNQIYPFDLLVEALNLDKNLNRNPIFDIAITMLNTAQKAKQYAVAFDDKIVSGGQEASVFDVEFIFQEVNDCLSFSVRYNTDIYESSDIETLMHHFRALMESVVLDPSVKIENINYLTDAERQKLLFDFNATDNEYARDQTVLDLFEAQAKRSPWQIALKDDAVNYSYLELDVLSNQIASYIISEFGSDDKSSIAVMLERSANMVALLLGILKAGRSYIPLDPKFPVDRLNYILANSEVKLLVNESSIHLDLETQNVQSVINLESLLEQCSKQTQPHKVSVLAEDTAYVIYTSGSTGNPKGVEIGHRSLVNFLLSMKQKPGISNQDTLFSVTTYSFDISILEFFLPLISGATLYVASHETLMDAGLIIAKLDEINPSILQATPSFYQLLIESGWKGLPGLKILCGGEQLNAALIKKLKNLCAEIWNMYGPTETTIWSTVKKIAEEKEDKVSNIGSPIYNTAIYILDNTLQLVPIGLPGAIYIGGEGLAKGYFKNPELTHLRFINNPYKANTLMYETGDLGRWMPDGSIEFLGRNDFQVKIRGHRIELGDIESVLINFSASLTQVVVAAQEQKGEKVLVAYYVSRESIDKSALRLFLQKELPDYMIPNFYVELEKVPLTPNGKVDRKALPGISESDIIRRAYVAPVSDQEIKLAQIWQDVLRVDQVGITDNFFELGGHSLIMVQVINHIFKELGKSLSFRDFFSHPTIEALCGKLQQSGYTAIPKAVESVSYPLTSSQNRLWLLSQFEGGSLAYNMSTAVAFKGTIEHSHFQNAFRILIERHEILRTSFQIASSGEVVQCIKAVGEIDFEIPEKDFTGIASQSDALNAYLQQQNNAPFDLANAPLIRGTLAKLKEEHYVFQLSLHHIIGDGWSMEILVSELVKVYNALLRGTEAGLEALRIQFKDYAVWTCSDAQQQKLQHSEQYWLSQFSGDLPVLDLGYKARPSVQRYHGESITHTFSKEFLQDLKHFSQEHDLTLFMTLMAGVNLLLHRYTRQDDIIIGTPIAGREHQDLENQIGLYLNTLAVRTRLESKGSFLDLVNLEKQVLLEAYDHQGYPLDELISQLDLKRDMSRSALFDVLVVLQNQAENLSTSEELINLEVSSYQLANKTSKFDLSYGFSQQDTLKLTITYNTDLYEGVFIERMFSHLENLLGHAIANPAVLLQDIDYLTALEKQQLLIGFNPAFTDYPKQTITALFEAQAQSNPKAVALVFENTKVSYESLLEQVNSVSEYLIDKGVSKGDKVILCLESHLEKAIAGILGILKAGAVYVPLDPDYPIERIKFIIEDTQAKYVLSNTIDAALFTNTDIEVILLDKLEKKYPQSVANGINILGSDPAYVIYTSGSTGNPKGVLVNHKNISDYVWGLSAAIAIESNASFGLMSTIATDLGNTVLFSSLAFGKTLHLFSKNSLRDVDYIQHYFSTHSLDCIKIVPSYWRALELGTPAGSPLKMIIFGGEELSIDLVRSIKSERPDIRIINHYGPTETTIGKLLHEVDADRDYYKIPIGRPFSNTRCYVVDEHLSLCPQGIIGELLIAGEGVSDGYLNNAGLTAEKFIADVFTDSSQKLYRTGDRVLMHFNGEIEFKGRIDNQVKILGHRIELSEIENVLNSHDAVSSSVVAVVSDANANQSLAAYVVYKTDAVEKIVLPEFLRSRLPAIMIPAVIVGIAEIPLTSNGKINRKALPAIAAQDIAGRTYTAPESAIEIKLAQIWKEVLKVEQVGITDNFFELGGNSLKVVKILYRVNHEFEIDINIKNVFKYPTIQDLAFHIIIAQKQKDISSTDKKLKEISL